MTQATRPDPSPPVIVAPVIVAVGGTTKPGSSTERALRAAAAAIEAGGARAVVFDGPFLAALPTYDPEAPLRNAAEVAFVDAVRACDGMIIASPGYHGGVSGLVKNAIDLLEETARDPRPYLDDLPVGLMVTAHGWQATAATLAALRAIVHALRGWPTPLGVAVNSQAVSFDPDDFRCSDPGVTAQIELMAHQVLGFARRASTARTTSAG